MRATRAWAYIQGRDFAVPEDLQAVLPWVVGHRLRSAETLATFEPDRLVDMLGEVAIP